MSLVTHLLKDVILRIKVFTICVLNAKVEFSGKLSKFKLDATTSVNYSFRYIIRDVRQQVFA